MLVHTPISTVPVLAVFLISVPSLGVYCQQVILSVFCLSVCHAPSNCFFFFVSLWNRSILTVSSPCGILQNVVLRFWICCHGNEIWAIFAKKIEIASFSFLDGIEPFLGR